MTVSCWIKPASDCSNRGGWFSYGGTATGRGSSYTFTGSYAQVKWYANDVDVYTGTTPNLKDDGWHHVVGVWDGTYRDLYVDGTRYTHQSGKPLNTDTSVLMVGKTMWDAAFKGWIDEVLVLNRAASADEIADLYATGISRTARTLAEVTVESGTLKSGLSSALAVAYPFDSEATLTEDASKTGATLTNNGATYSTDSALGTGGSAAFDGSSSFLSLATFPSAIPSGNAARTLLCFAKSAASPTAEGAFISYGNETWGKGDYLNFACRSSGAKIGLYPWGAENGCFGFSSSELSSGWHSFVAVWDGSKVSLYKDGSQKLAPTAFTDGLTLNTKAAGFKIGKAFYNGTSFFKGNLDEVAVCNRALTAEEIASYHQKGLEAFRAQPLSATVALNLKAGATFDSSTQDQTIAGLDGAGVITVESLTLTERLAGSTTVNGDLTLGDGIVIRAGATPTTVSGKGATFEINRSGLTPLVSGAYDWVARGECSFPIRGAFGKGVKSIRLPAGMPTTGYRGIMPVKVVAAEGDATGEGALAALDFDVAKGEVKSELLILCPGCGYTLPPQVIAYGPDYETAYTCEVELTDEDQKPGPIVKTGVGELMFNSSDNTYAGTYIVSNGLLLVNANATIASGASVLLAGGRFSYDWTDRTIKSLGGYGGFYGCKNDDGANSIAVTDSLDFDVADLNEGRCLEMESDLGDKQQVARDYLSLGADCVVRLAHPELLSEDVKAYTLLKVNVPLNRKPVLENADKIGDGQWKVKLTNGGKTLKLENSHRGAGWSVRNVLTGAVSITAQSHAFAVDAASLPAELEVVYENMADGSVEGIRHKTQPALGVEFDPESAPDAEGKPCYFPEFLQLIRAAKN